MPAAAQAWSRAFITLFSRNFRQPACTGKPRTGYVFTMQPLVLMGIVLGTAVLWTAVIFVMLSRLERVQRKNLGMARQKAVRALSDKRAHTSGGTK